ncbi:MAG: alpha/beta hydrolase [Gemmatimonadetes bacterium]|nr:alpha/beta hydrolase [Gemmatimonadota bacterium]
MPYACLNEYRMFYEVRGEGEAAVFIHGGFPSIDMHLRAPSIGAWTWETEFAAACRFIAYERRGCWRSARTESGYDLENQAEDLVALLNHLEVDAAHVIGSSAGGPIALLFAATYPERTRTLVLAGTGANLWPDEDPVTRIVKEQLEFSKNRARKQSGTTGRQASSFRWTYCGSGKR